MEMPACDISRWSLVIYTTKEAKRVEALRESESSEGTGPEEQEPLESVLMCDVSLCTKCNISIVCPIV